MGYPPPPRRGNDKKRYYYSNNPNRRHNNSYSHRPYGPSYSSYPPSQQPGDARPHSNQSQNSIPTGSNATLPQTSSEPHTGPPSSSDSNRPSRYNQKSSGSAFPQSHRPLSTPTAPSGINIPTTPSGSNFGKHGTSRYNNDSNEYVHQPIPTHTSMQIQSGMATHSSDSSNHVKSRYSSSTPSRYNASGNGVVVPTGPSTDSHTPTKPSTNVPYVQHRSRPKSMDSSSPSFDPHYNHNPHPQSAGSTSYHSSSNSGPTPFFNRRNKWGSHGSYQSSNGHSDKYQSTQFQNGRSNVWRGSSSTHSDSVGSTDATPQDLRFTHDIDEQSTDSSVSELQTVPSRSTKGNFSPGGSLIRSVPLITKELSEQMSLEHRNTSQIGRAHV